jgi:hypothetical protein
MEQRLSHIKEEYTDLPPRYFRFIDKQYIGTILHDREFRFGALEYYREMERRTKDRDRGDLMEGRWRGRFPGLTFSSPTGPKSIAQQNMERSGLVYISPTAGHGNVVIGGEVGINFDGWVYCFSQLLTPTHFYPDGRPIQPPGLNSDACLEVLNPRDLVNHMVSYGQVYIDQDGSKRQIGRLRDLFRIFHKQVTYVPSKMQDLTTEKYEPLPGPMFKEDYYAHQLEYRLFLMARAPDINAKFLYVKLPRVSHLVRQVEI